MSRLNRNRKFSWGYAFGELILITLGIYLAFLLGSWNESRKERKLEQFYLGNLAAEVDRSINQLNWHLRIDSVHIDGARVLDGLLAQGRRVDRDSLKLYLNSFNVNPRYRLNNYSYQSLLESGDYRMIQSNELRNSLDQFFLEFLPGVITTEDWYLERLDKQFYPIKESVLMARSGEFIDINRLFDPQFRDNVYVLPSYIHQEMRQLKTTLEAAKELKKAIEAEME